jgi:hypothetical protein
VIGIRREKHGGVINIRHEDFSLVAKDFYQTDGIRSETWKESREIRGGGYAGG